MKSTSAPFIKVTLYTFIISLLIALPIFATWASTVTSDDVKLLKMWIKLAIDGYAEPMPMPGEKPWWRVW